LRETGQGITVGDIGRYPCPGCPDTGNAFFDKVEKQDRKRYYEGKEPDKVVSAVPRDRYPRRIYTPFGG